MMDPQARQAREPAARGARDPRHASHIGEAGLVSRTDSALDALLDLFESELAEVVFPDLGVATLRDADAAVEQCRREVADAEEALAASARALDEARHAFERVGRKAVAYAQVYADGAPELATRLGAIARDLVAAPRLEPAPVEPARRRGRPRKADAMLFGSASSSVSPSSPGELPAARGLRSETEADTEADTDVDTEQDARHGAAELAAE